MVTTAKNIAPITFDTLVTGMLRRGGGGAEGGRVTSDTIEQLVVQIYIYIRFYIIFILN